MAHPRFVLAEKGKERSRGGDALAFRVRSETWRAVAGCVLIAGARPGIQKGRSTNLISNNFDSSGLPCLRIRGASIDTFAVHWPRIGTHNYMVKVQLFRQDEIV